MNRGAMSAGLVMAATTTAVLVVGPAGAAKPPPPYVPGYEYVSNQPTDLVVGGVTRNVTVDARCSTGNVLVSGGAAYAYSTRGTPTGDTTTFNPAITLVSSYPFKGTFWRAEWHVADPSVTAVSELRAFAVCVNPR